MATCIDDKELQRLVSGFGAREKSFLYCPLLSAALAGRQEKALRLIIGDALNHGVSPKTIDEIILQSHLFLGFPAMIEASRLFADIRGRRPASPKVPAPYTEKNCTGWNASGLAKIKKIYGPAFERLVRYINAFSPQILTWMINDGYGQVLSRPGASFALRELSVVATLTVTAYENQLKAHIHGALNVGVDASLMADTIDRCRYFCPAGHIQSARAILEKLRAA